MPTPTPPSPPVPPVPNPTRAFRSTNGSYCDSARGHSWAYTANKRTLDECAEQCLILGCDAFEYTPHVADPQPYIFNCRILHPHDAYTITHSGQGYTAYTREQQPNPPPPKGNGGVLTYGLMGGVASVPKGFELEYVLVAGEGPNAAVRRWGGLLTSRYNKTNPRNNDYTTTHLGYDTDNGAYYYYNPETGKTYDQTLLDVHAYAERVGIPYKHVQLDSWWYIKGAGGGTKSWTPGPNTFPQGLAPFHNKTGWKITAHNRMWSSDNVYATQNGGKFKWIIEGSEAG